MALAVMSPQKSVNIINVPMGLGASKEGADCAPQALRRAGLHEALRVSGKRISGEVNIPLDAPSNDELKFSGYKKHKARIHSMCSRLAEHTFATVRDKQIPLIIGGDHSLAMGSVSGVSASLRAKGESLGLLWFDAHGDMNTPDTSPSGNIHGMPLAHLLGLGDPSFVRLGGNEAAVKAEHVAMIGVRDIDAQEAELIRETGIRIFSMECIRTLGMAEVARQALEIVNKGTAGFHLSFDVDGCDPSVIPGSGTLVDDGVSLEDTHTLLAACAADKRMLSMDVVELNPLLDAEHQSTQHVIAMIQRALGPVNTN